MEISSRLINEAASSLDKAGTDSPRLCARLLMALVLGCSQERLISYPDLVLSSKDILLYREYVSRRIQGEPLAYITGQKEFYGRDFAVDTNVLIPRPETELLAELAIKHYISFAGPVFADIGTGSGNICVTLALEMPSCLGLACDISLQAIRVARSNAKNHCVHNRLIFFQSDLGMGIKPGSLDFIVSNPPYLSNKEFLAASFEVTRHEPVHALVSPEKGFLHFKRLEKISGLLLKEGGMIILEMGKDQGELVSSIFSGWKNILIHKDLAGHDRVFTACRKAGAG